MKVLQEHEGRLKDQKTQLPPLVASSLVILVEQSTEIPCSMEPVPKNSKLGIEGKGEVNSKVLESLRLQKENLAEAEQGVDGSAMKEENDVLHVNAGDSALETIGDPVPLPKLMS